MIHGGEPIHSGEPTYRVAWPGHPVCGLPTMYGFPTMYYGVPGTGPALPKSKTSNCLAPLFSCFWFQKHQYTCFFEKGHAQNPNKEAPARQPVDTVVRCPLPGNRWTLSFELGFTKSQQILVSINQSDILPHPHNVGHIDASDHIYPLGPHKPIFLFKINWLYSKWVQNP